jgi:hypothetical protein
MDGGFEGGVSQAPFPSLGHHKATVRLDKIKQNLVGLPVPDHGSHGNTKEEILAAPSLSVASFAMRSPFGFEDGSKSKVGQRIDIGVGDKNDAPTIPTSPSIGAAVWNTLFPPEAEAAVSSLSGQKGDLNLIYKHVCPNYSGKWRSVQGANRLPSKNRDQRDRKIRPGTGLHSNGSCAQYRPPLSSLYGRDGFEEG